MPLPISSISVAVAIVCALLYDGSHGLVTGVVAAILGSFALVNELLRFAALNAAPPAPPAGPRQRQMTPHVGAEED